MIFSKINVIGPLFLGLFLVLSAAGPSQAAEKKAKAFNVPPVDALVDYFEEIVFGSDVDPKYKLKVITKWTEKLKISVRGKPSKAVIAALQKHSQAVLPLAGIGAKTVKKDANLQITFIPKGGKINLGKKSITVTGPGCSFFSQSKEGKIYLTQIIVNNIGGDDQISHCLLEEFTQSLGLPNDSDNLRPSVFSEKDKLQTLTLPDKILLSTLYHPRMMPGMKRKQALLVARDIIGDYRKGMVLMVQSIKGR